METKVLPILGFTVGNGLLLDIDHFTTNAVLDLAEETTKIYDCGDALIMKSSSKGQLTIFGEKTFGFHIIFGKEMTYEKVQAILNILARKRVIEELFRWFHVVEREQTLRLNPKRAGQKWPEKFAYIHFTGENSVIKTYLENFEITKKALEWRCK